MSSMVFQIASSHICAQNRIAASVISIWSVAINAYPRSELSGGSSSVSLSLDGLSPSAALKSLPIFGAMLARNDNCPVVPTVVYITESSKPYVGIVEWDSCPGVVILGSLKTGT